MALDKESAAAFEIAVDRQVGYLISVCICALYCIVHVFEHYHLMQYWYELFLDDLPMWGMVGEVLRDDQHQRLEKVWLQLNVHTVCP